jgi:hypothetical protein
MNDTVTAMATRAECLTEGRFSRSHFQTFTKSDLSHPSEVRKIKFNGGAGDTAASLSTFVDKMYGYCSLGSICPDHACNCSGSSFLRAPVQSQRRDQEKKDNYDPYVREKVQSKRTKFFFIKFKSFDQPWNIGMPQSQGDNPVKQREKDSNGKGAQEKVSEENDFFAFHDSSVISDGGIGARLSDPRNLRE